MQDQKLNEEFRLGYIRDLVARKLGGPEKALLVDADVSFYKNKYERLRGALEESAKTSPLPGSPSCKSALNDLLVRLRIDK